MPGILRRCLGFLGEVAFLGVCILDHMLETLPERGMPSPYLLSAHQHPCPDTEAGRQQHRDCTEGKLPAAFAAELWETALR